MYRYIICLLLILAVGGDSFGNNLLKQGNEAYAKGRFQEASNAYQKLIAQGYASSAVYYNLGNAHYRLNEIPEAILYYEKAYKLSPGDEDIEVNLLFAKQKIRDKIEAVPEFFLAKWWKGLMTTFSLQVWSVITVILFLIGFALLTAYLFARGVLKRTAFYSGIVVLAMGLFSLLISVKLNHYLSSNQHGIIFSGTVNVKSAPGSGQKTIFVVHEGLKVQIGAKENDWVEITLPNGAEGWVEFSFIKEI